MATKISRKAAKILGLTAGTDQIGIFGSLAAAAPAFSTDPDAIQSLSQFSNGWFAAILGLSNPALEDMNALAYLYSYQIAYTLQAGVAEWNSATEYFIGSIANDGLGNLYKSLTDSNLNNNPSDPTNWTPAVVDSFIYPTCQRFDTAGTFTYHPTTVFTVVSANATIGATYTNNGVTFTVSRTIATGTRLEATGNGTALNSGTLTKASGTGDATITFTRSKQPLYLRIKMIGAGAGGSGSGSAPGASSNAGSSTVGLILAAGGGGGTTSTGNLGGAGGTNTVTSGVVPITVFQNKIGGTGGPSNLSGTGGVNSSGGQGGVSFYGGNGGGAVGQGTGPGGNAAANSGSGGGGAANAAAGLSGCGGGAGGHLDVGIPFTLSIGVVVGAKTAGGTAGGSGTAGGDGSDGEVVFEELYQ